MEKNQDKFELDFGDGRIKVARHSTGSNVVFSVIFSDHRKPLVLTRAIHGLTNKQENMLKALPLLQQLQTN